MCSSERKRLKITSGHGDNYCLVLMLLSGVWLVPRLLVLSWSWTLRAALGQTSCRHALDASGVRRRAGSLIFSKMSTILGRSNLFESISVVSQSVSLNLSFCRAAFYWHVCNMSICLYLSVLLPPPFFSLSLALLSLCLSVCLSICLSASSPPPPCYSNKPFGPLNKSLLFPARQSIIMSIHSSLSLYFSVSVSLSFSLPPFLPLSFPLALSNFDPNMSKCYKPLFFHFFTPLFPSLHINSKPHLL